MLNMSWLGEKGISLQRGKKWTTKGGLFCLFVFQIIFFTFWEVRQERRGCSFFNLRLEKCPCSWLPEKKEVAKDCVLTCLRLLLSRVYKIIQPVELFLMYGSVQQEQHNTPSQLIIILPENPRDVTNKLSFPPCNNVYIKILIESLEKYLQSMELFKYIPVQKTQLGEKIKKKSSKRIKL